MSQTLISKIINTKKPAVSRNTINLKLPTQQFTYGKKDKPDKEGVSISIYLFNNSH